MAHRWRSECPKLFGFYSIFNIRCNIKCITAAHVLPPSLVVISAGPLYGPSSVLFIALILNTYEVKGLRFFTVQLVLEPSYTHVQPGKELTVF